MVAKMSVLWQHLLGCYEIHAAVSQTYKSSLLAYALQRPFVHRRWRILPTCPIGNSPPRAEEFATRQERQPQAEGCRSNLFIFVGDVPNANKNSASLSHCEGDEEDTITSVSSFDQKYSHLVSRQILPCRSLENTALS